jgi:hypothetical protein
MRKGSGREWFRAFPDCGPLAEDSATKLQRGQLNVCNVYVYLCGVQYSFPPAAEICPGNFCQ